jgi:alkanesulfonate monooxygenase SsuD/methylene tetrahydromethanopterin reductase-like flavin-dependent oxidoreductase (luciferase family)
MRPRFGIGIVPSASGRSDPAGQARRAEELGFDLVTIWDHPHGEHPSFELWTLLTWIAARTSRIAVASDVLGLPFRLPAMIAKMSESLDRLSDGRLILGLGSGGSEAELAGFGVRPLSPAERVDAFEEALDVIRGVWGSARFTHAGRHYHTEAAQLEPKPARAIPIWIGAYGPRMLELTGRLGDGWIPSMAYLPPDDARPAMDAVRESAERAGRDPATLDYAYNVSVRIDDRSAGDPGRQVVGEPSAVVERLAGLLELGFTVLNLFPGGRRDEQVERLGAEVLPALRRLG